MQLLSYLMKLRPGDKTKQKIPSSGIAVFYVVRVFLWEETPQALIFYLSIEKKLERGFLLTIPGDAYSTSLQRELYIVWSIIVTSGINYLWARVSNECSQVLTIDII